MLPLFKRVAHVSFGAAAGGCDRKYGNTREESPEMPGKRRFSHASFGSQGP